MSGISSSTYYSGFTASQNDTINYTNLLGAQTSQLLGLSSTPQLDSTPLAAQPTSSSNFAYGQLTADQAFAGYMQTAYTAAQSLYTQYQSGAFSAATATSSDSGISASAQGAATAGSYQVSVSALAQGQQIQSNSLSTTGTNVAAGTYSFALTTGSNTQGSTTTNVTLAVNSGDSNQTVLDNLAQAINQSGAGASASVVADSSGNVRLQVTNSLTGQGATLSVADGSGNLASQIGLTANGTATSTTGGTSQVAQNSAYNVDGTAYTSYGNAAYLDNGNLQLTFDKTTNGVATVSVAKDSSSFNTAVGSFVTAYNNAVSFANSSGGYASGMLSTLQQTATQFSSDFSQAGLTFNNDGTLAFNSSTFASTATSNPGQMGVIANDLASFSTQSLSSLNLQSSSLVSQALIAQQQMTTTNPDSQYVNPYLSSLLVPMSTTSLFM